MVDDTYNANSPSAVFKDGINTGMQYLEISFPDTDSLVADDLVKSILEFAANNSLQDFNYTYVLKPTNQPVDKNKLNKKLLVSYKRSGNISDDEVIQEDLTSLLLEAGVKVQGESYIDILERSYNRHYNSLEVLEEHNISPRVESVLNALSDTDYLSYKDFTHAWIICIDNDGKQNTAKLLTFLNPAYESIPFDFAMRISEEIMARDKSGLISKRLNDMGQEIVCREFATYRTRLADFWQQYCKGLDNKNLSHEQRELAKRDFWLFITDKGSVALNKSNDFKDFYKDFEHYIHSDSVGSAKNLLMMEFVKAIMEKETLLPDTGTKKDFTLTDNSASPVRVGNAGAEQQTQTIRNILSNQRI